MIESDCYYVEYMCKCSLSSIDLRLIFFEIVEVLLNRFEIMVGNFM